MGSYCKQRCSDFLILPRKTSFKSNYNFDIHRAVRGNIISIVKPTRCTNVSNLFYFGLYILRCCATNRKVAGSIPAGVSGFFTDIKSFRSHYGPGVESASNRNEYQEHFLGVKSGRCVRLTTLPTFCAVVTKSGKLNFLEPSGPVQTSNGIDLPFLLYKFRKVFPSIIRSSRLYLQRQASKQTAVSILQLYVQY